MAAPINPRFIQTQSFQISASGASVGDTTLIIQSFKYPDGITNIVTADLGDWCYGTLEPNNGSQEEAIQFTGVTQNANGTATLTGVSSVGFKYPYTLTTGLSKSHAGGVTFIISNDAGMYGNLITYFGSTLASGIAPNASLSSQGSVQLPTQVQVDSKTATGSTGAGLAVTPDTARSTKLSDYVIDIGTANAYAIAPSPVITSYATGQTFTFKALSTSASGATLTVNGLSAVPLKKNVNVTLSSGDILPNQLVEVEHDGTNFQVISSPTPGVLAGNLVQFNGSAQFPANDGSLITGVNKLLTTLSTGSTSSSTTELVFVSVSIPGNTLGTTHAIRCRFPFSMSAVGTMTFKVKYGATTLITEGVTISDSNTTSLPHGMIDIMLYSAGATNSQYATIGGVLIGNGGSSTFNANLSHGIANSGISAEDSTAAKTFAVSVTSSSSVTGTVYGATVEIL